MSAHGETMRKLMRFERLAADFIARRTSTPGPRRLHDEPIDRIWRVVTDPIRSGSFCPGCEERRRIAHAIDPIRWANFVEVRFGAAGDPASPRDLEDRA